MICKLCGGEFDTANFDICPYCLSPFYEDHPQKAVMINDNIIEEQEDEIKNYLEEDDNYINGNNDIQTKYTLGESIGGKTEQYQQDVKNKLDIVIEDIVGLSNRARNALKRNKIVTISNLEEFLQGNMIEDLPSIGVNTAKEIKNVLELYGIDEDEQFKLSDIEEKNIGVSSLFENISSDNINLPISATNIFGLSSKTIEILKENNISYIGDLKNYSIRSFERMMGRKSTKKLIDISHKLEKSLISLTEEILLSEFEGRQCQIYLRRANGETLQEVADNLRIYGEGSLTRERVRQIESKFFKKIELFIKEIINLIMKERRYILAQDILDVYESDDFTRILIYTCKLDKELQYLDFADVFVVKNEDISEEEKLLNLTEDFIGEGINLYEKLEELETLLNDNGFDYIGLGEFINLLQKYKYHFYKDFVTRGKQSYGVLCRNVVKNHFPFGIKVTQSENDEGGDLTKLRKLVYKEYGDIGLPPNDRALSARLGDYLVLCNRGMLISAENIILDESVLEDIKNAIDNTLSDKVYYAELFAEFQGILQMTSNIDNYNFLHGVLRLYYADEYNFSNRDYLLKTHSGISVEQGGVAERIKKFINEMRRPVHKNELKRKFPGFSDVMLVIPIINNKDLIQWEYNYYTCMDLIDCQEEDYIKLRSILLEELEENEGYASDSMVFHRVKEEYNSFIEKNNIKLAMNLYYILSALFDDLCDFRRPHISVKGKFESFTTVDIVLHLMKYPRILKYEEFISVSERMEWAPVTSGMVFSNLEQQYFRISQEDYILREELSIENDTLDKIQNRVIEELQYDFMSIVNFNQYDDLPDIGYQWNEFLLGTILEYFCRDIKVIYPIVKDRRYQKGVATKSNNGLNSYSEVVANVMISNGITAMGESDFLSFLIIHGLAKKTIPKELMNSEFVKYEDQKYKVVV